MTVWGRKEISNSVKEAIVAAHQSGKDYEAIPKQFEVHHSREKDYSQMENILYNCHAS